MWRWTYSSRRQSSRSQRKGIHGKLCDKKSEQARRNAVSIGSRDGSVHLMRSANQTTGRHARCDLVISPSTQSSSSEEQRKLLNQWDGGVLKGDRLMELLLRLDRADSIVAQSVAVGTSSNKSNYLNELQPTEQQHDALSGPALPPVSSSFLQNDGGQMQDRKSVV